MERVAKELEGWSTDDGKIEHSLDWRSVRGGRALKESHRVHKSLH